MIGEGLPDRHDPVCHPPGIQPQLQMLLLHKVAQCMEHSQSDKPQQKQLYSVPEKFATCFFIALITQSHTALHAGRVPVFSICCFVYRILLVREFTVKDGYYK